MDDPEQISQLRSGSTHQPSIFQALCHASYPHIATEINDYFLKHWKFRDEKSRRKFLTADYSRFACLNYPLTSNDRIGFACRIITLLFLVDDEIDFMPIEEGKEYNERLILIAQGMKRPNPAIPAEWMMWDLWEDMRNHDEELAKTVQAPCFLFMRAQVDKIRLNQSDLSLYFEFRQDDIGTDLVCAIMTFGMGMTLTDEEQEIVSPIVTNFSKHIICVNDIYSYERELRVQEESGQTGGKIVSSVPIVASLLKVGPESAKRVLWTMCREWEISHRLLAERVLNAHPSLKLEMYFKGLEYQFVGNELWSHETGRYK
ncbi:Aristolochene synthase [Xylaria sp. FL0933]|nr:Aristolochene synthase [Xylaria sp. FL0933]